MNNTAIGIERMTNISQAISYFDGRLFDRLSDDSITDIRDLFGSGMHLLAKAGDKVVGIVTFSSISSRCLIIHPKIKQEFMIYAERICNAAIEFTKDLAESITIIAMIPQQFKANIKMAINCGFKENGVIPESFLKNGKLYDQIIYSKRLL